MSFQRYIWVLRKLREKVPKLDTQIILEKGIYTYTDTHTHTYIYLCIQLHIIHMDIITSFRIHEYAYNISAIIMFYIHSLESVSKPAQPSMK